MRNYFSKWFEACRKPTSSTGKSANETQKECEQCQKVRAYMEFRDATRSKIYYMMGERELQTAYQLTQKLLDYLEILKNDERLAADDNFFWMYLEDSKDFLLLRDEIGRGQLGSESPSRYTN